MRHKALRSRSGPVSVVLYIVLLAALFVALVIAAAAEPKTAAAYCERHMTAYSNPPANDMPVRSGATD